MARKSNLKNRGSKKQTASRSKGGSSNQAQRNPWLVLSLVPLIIGALMVIFWGLDIYLWEPADTQITIGVLFILLSFASSNAIQKNWYPAVGWILIAVADFVILTSLVGWIQIIGFVVGGIGLILIGIEFYQRWKQRSSQ
jgi:hypothetical protein